MRPIAHKQDPLRSPLNDLLNAEANVRLLRVLSETEEPLSAQDAAERAELTEPGARLALKRLVATGFVRRLGGGPYQRFGLRLEDPLAEAIVSLFATERRRYEALLVALRLAVVNSSSPPRSAWISRLPDEPGEPLEIAALHRARELPGFMREIREKLSFIETSFDITIEVDGFTRADLPEIDFARFVALVGPPPPGAETESVIAAEEDGNLEPESGRFVEAVAELLEADPSLVQRALRYLNGALQAEPGDAEEDLREWVRVLSSYPIRRLQRFVTSTSLRALRLRRCSPFAEILTDTERQRLRDIVAAGE